MAQPSKSRSSTSRKPGRTRAVKAKQPPSMPRPAGKLGAIIDLVSKESGATADELVAETGWQRHSILGALSRLRTRGFAMHLAEDGVRRAYKLDVQVGPR